jgi:hypothetical protein
MRWHDKYEKKIEANKVNGILHRLEPVGGFSLARDTVDIARIS